MLKYKHIYLLLIYFISVMNRERRIFKWRKLIFEFRIALRFPRARSSQMLPNLDELIHFMFQSFVISSRWRSLICLKYNRNCYKFSSESFWCVWIQTQSSHLNRELDFDIYHCRAVLKYISYCKTIFNSCYLYSNAYYQYYLKFFYCDNF